MQHLPAPASDVNGAKVSVNGGRDTHLLLLLGSDCPQCPSPQQEQQKQTRLPLSWCGFFFKPKNYLKIEPPTPH